MQLETIDMRQDEFNSLLKKVSKDTPTLELLVIKDTTDDSLDISLNIDNLTNFDLYKIYSGLLTSLFEQGNIAQKADLVKMLIELISSWSDKVE